MKKIIPILIIGVFLISSFGAIAYNNEDENSFNKNYELTNETRVGSGFSFSKYTS